MPIKYIVRGAFVIILKFPLYNVKLEHINILSELFHLKLTINNNKAERTCCKVATRLTCKMLNCILKFLLWLDDWVALV